MIGPWVIESMISESKYVNWLFMNNSRMIHGLTRSTTLYSLYIRDGNDSNIRSSRQEFHISPLGLPETLGQSTDGSVLLNNTTINSKRVIFFIHVTSKGLRWTVHYSVCLTYIFVCILWSTEDTSVCNSS